MKFYHEEWSFGLKKKKEISYRENVCLIRSSRNEGNQHIALSVGNGSLVRLSLSTINAFTQGRSPIHVENAAGASPRRSILINTEGLTLERSRFAAQIAGNASHRGLP